MDSNFPAGDLLFAVNFAATKHKFQKRKGDNSPYINHPIGVANILAKEGGITDVTTLIAAVLHDTVEDTKTTFEEIEQNFGSKVRKIVEEVTDNKSLSKDERKRQQIKHATHASKEAKLVKLADKLFNLRDLLVLPPPSWDAKRIQGYFVWGQKVIDGIKGTNELLEKQLDIVFASEFNYKGQSYPVIPKDTNLNEFLEDYYKSMAEAKD